MTWSGSIAKVTLTAGGILLLAGCGGREKVAIAAKDETIRRQEQQIVQSEAERNRISTMNEQLAKQNDEMASRNAEAARRNAQETAELRQQMNSMQTSLQEQLKGLSIAQSKTGEKGVEAGRDSNYVVEKDGKIRITVASTVLFDSGDAALKPSAHSLLKNVATTIKTRFGSNYIRIEGHTDSVPVVRNKNKYPDNMALSIARSRAVYDFMSQEGGLAAGKMYTAGYGEHQPLVYPEKTAADRSKNRRVEIVIMPNDVKVTKDRLADAQRTSAPVRK